MNHHAAVKRPRLSVTTTKVSRSSGSAGGGGGGGAATGGETERCSHASCGKNVIAMANIGSTNNNNNNNNMSSPSSSILNVSSVVSNNVPPRREEKEEEGGGGGGGGGGGRGRRRSGSSSSSSPVSSPNHLHSNSNNNNYGPSSHSPHSSTSTSLSSHRHCPMSSPRRCASDRFEVFVGKESFKFNAAHFIAYKGFRERLHGHNYQATIRLRGNRIGPDGYVIDFGIIKNIMKQICKRMNEHFLLPMKSDVLVIDIKDGNVHIACEDGTIFEFPEGDCLKLPIVHSSVEEIARYMLTEIIVHVSRRYLENRGVQVVELSVSEAPGQQATIRRDVRDPHRDDTHRETGPVGAGELASRMGYPPRHCMSNQIRSRAGGNGGGNGGSGTLAIGDEASLLGASAPVAGPASSFAH